MLTGLDECYMRFTRQLSGPSNLVSRTIDTMKEHTDTCIIPLLEKGLFPLHTIHNKLNDKILTLPHEDLGVSLTSPASSSARPHEQSAHAFRLPVVEQTENIYFKN